MEKKLYRDEQHKMIGGVCAGLGEYFDTDVTVVRLLFAFTVIIMGVGLVPYIIMWIVLPKKGYGFINYNDPKVDYTVPPITPPNANDPFLNVMPKRKSNAGLIFGVILIVLGGIFLLDQLDWIPDFDYGRLWPLVLVAVGIALIAGGQKREPWHEPNWHNVDEKSDVVNENSVNDNPPTV